MIKPFLTLAGGGGGGGVINEILNKEGALLVIFRSEEGGPGKNFHPSKYSPPPPPFYINNDRSPVYDLLGDRRIDDVTITNKTNRFHVAVRLFSNRYQMTSNVLRTKKGYKRRSRVCH